MKVLFENQILTVKTGITEELVKKAGGKRLVVKDDKGNEVYALSRTSNPDDASINKFGITTNAVVDGELAVLIVMPTDTTIEDVKQCFGEDLVAAHKYLPELATQIMTRAEAIDAIFA